MFDCRQTPYPAGNSPLEKLPNELLFRVFDLAMTQSKTISVGQRSWFMAKSLPVATNDIQQNCTLWSYLLVSHRLNEVVLPHFYRNIKLNQQELLGKRRHDNLFGTLSKNPNLASLIRSLDFSEYQKPLWSSILPTAVSLLPRLKSLHLQLEQLVSLDKEDAFRIFFELPELQNLSIENIDGRIDSSSLAHMLLSLGVNDQTANSNIHSLTLRNGSGRLHSWPPQTIPFVDSDIFSKFLPRFPKLRSLDLAHTSIDPNAFFNISSCARLQYLRISNCKGTDTTLAMFLATHPAAKDSLVVFDGSGVEFGEQDTTSILARLPPTLRSLNLDSSLMNATHIPQLQRLSRHLEEMKLGYGLSMENLEVVLLGSDFRFDNDETARAGRSEETAKEGLEHEPVLGPMRDAIAICMLRRRLASVSPISPSIRVGRSRIRYLDLSSIDGEEQGRLANSVLLGAYSTPLQCVVVSGIGVESERILEKISSGCGWRNRWVNGMTWIERQ